ncbi:MAG TPA: hypothetical protein VFA90_12830 [Terriglobales bacterium]|nr:hypothetical protein [Terriglobales bacterium]
MVATDDTNKVGKKVDHGNSVTIRADAKDIATVQRSGFIDLGLIKGNIGDQNYALSNDLDLAKYRAVMMLVPVQLPDCP